MLPRNLRSLSIAWVLCFASSALGAQVRTQNFIINAPTQQVAQQVAQYAEQHRRDKAIQWLGQEMPTWNQPCPLVVKVSMEGPSGATTFQFGQGQVLSMHMEIQGPLDRLLHSVLPHEITHTVFAHHFRCPVPRWADEGGSVLSEDDLERDRHDKLTRSILNQGKQIPLRRLLALKDYPREVMCLYAQGFSMADYLVKRSDRRTFLSFVGFGMQAGWDQAAQNYYGHRSVEELEEAWLKHLRDTKRNPNQSPSAEVQLAQNPQAPPQAIAPLQQQALAAVQPKTNQPNAYQPGYAAGRPSVRLTVPPVQPLDPSPVVRGAAPSNDQVGQRFGAPQPTAPMLGEGNVVAVTPPIYIPTSQIPRGPTPGAGWQPLR